MKLCRDTGTAFVVTDLGLDTSTPAGEMVLGVLAQIAQFEARMIGARVAASNVQRVREGRALGGPIPFGFANADHADRPGTYRVVDPEQAAVVDRMVSELLAGYSLHKIAKGLYDDRIPSPRQANAIRRRARDPKADPPPATPYRWTYGAVVRVLSNPALAGHQVHRGELVRDPATGLPRVLDAAILTPSEWRGVQTALAARSTNGDARRLRTPSADRPLLDGIAICAGCGGRLGRSSSTGPRLPDGTARKRYYNYACQRRPACDAPASIHANNLDAFVTDRFLAAVGSHVIVRQVESENAEHAETLRQLRAEIDDAGEQIKTATPADIPALAERLAALRQAEDETIRLAAESPAIGYEPVLVDGRPQTFAAQWQALDGDTAGRRSLLARAIDAVSVTKMRGCHAVSERVVILWRHDAEQFDAAEDAEQDAALDALLAARAAAE